MSTKETAPENSPGPDGWITTGDMTVDVAPGKQIKLAAGRRVDLAQMPKGWPPDAVIAAGFVRRPGPGD